MPIIPQPNFITHTCLCIQTFGNRESIGQGCRDVFQYNQVNDVWRRDGSILKSSSMVIGLTGVPTPFSGSPLCSGACLHAFCVVRSKTKIILIVTVYTDFKLLYLLFGMKLWIISEPVIEIMDAGNRNGALTKKYV